MVKQTAGRDALGAFAPKFAELNDDVLFGEVWSREDQLSLKLRSMITITVLVSKGMIDSSFQYHLATARQNGVTKNEMAEMLTHIAFYAGWPNAWAASAWRWRSIRMIPAQMAVSSVWVNQMMPTPNTLQVNPTSIPSPIPMKPYSLPM